MATLTSRLKLRKPASTDVVNVDTDISANMDAIDAAVGFEVVTSGTRPSIPYTGQTIFETDTGRYYIWDGAAWDKLIINGSTELSNISSQYGGNGFKNLLLNAVGFPINQRSPGGVFTVPTGFVCDRWQLAPGTGSTNTIQHFATTFRTGYGYEGNRNQINWARSVAGSSPGYFKARHENVAYASGKKVTFSFLCATGGGSIDFVPYVAQNFGTGGAPSATVTTVGTVLTADTTVKVLTVTFDIPSIQGKTLGTNGDDFLEFGVYRDNAAVNGATGTLAFNAIQAEFGPVFTGFEIRPIPLELTMCQRYYWRLWSDAGLQLVGPGFQSSTTNANIFVPFPVRMFKTPTLNVSAASDLSIAGTGASIPGSAVSFPRTGLESTQLNITISGGTAGQGCLAAFNASGKWIEASAEV